MIRFEHVTKYFEDTKDMALNDLSFHVGMGEFMFVTGESGSGKSTIIRLLLRELTPTSGEVFVEGRPISEVSHQKLPKYRRGLGVIFQDFQLVPDKTVYENVALALLVAGVTGSMADRQVSSILSFLKLNRKYNCYPAQLSGGEQQKVCLARAIVNRPKLLLADEPTGNLDPASAKELMYLLDEIHVRGTTVLVVTHNLELVEELQHKVLKLGTERE